MELETTTQEEQRWETKEAVKLPAMTIKAEENA